MKASARHRPPHASTAAKLIAVGVDDDAGGRDATVLGAMIARPLDAELMLVAVHPDPVLVPWWSGVDSPINWTAMEQRANAILRELRDEVAPNARTVVETDWSVSRALERVVRREHRDLLIVGSSRDAPGGHLRIGNLTRQLLGDARCALAIAPRGLGARAPRPITTIGVGFDGGPESRDALSRAGALARAAGAKLRVRALVDDQPSTIGWWEPRRQDRATFAERVETAVGSLRDLAEQAGSSTGADVQVEVEAGSPADRLKHLSQEIDLLVIGSRRWGPAGRVLLGSTGEQLMQEAGCAVMVVARPAG